MKAFRRGSTVKVWSRDPSDVRLFPRLPMRGFPSIWFFFAMPSKGGGDTEVKLEVPKDDFRNVMRAMSAASEDATVRAVGETLCDSKNPHFKACGELLLDQLDADSTPVVPSKDPATVVSFVKKAVA